MALPKITNKYTDYGEDKIPIHFFRIDYKQLFDINYIYYALRDWFIDNKWATRIDSEFPEQLMIVRDNPQFGKELWIQWRFEKTPQPEKTKLWKYVLDVDWHILGMKDAEIVVNGKKVKANKGQLELDVRANLIFDYSKSWAKTSILKAHKNWLMRNFYRKTFSKYKRVLHEEATKLQDAMKEYLRIKGYYEEKEMAFWDQRPPG